MSAHDTPVVLALMPYLDVSRPSIALGTLKACLTRAGIGCTVDYANVRFMERLGLDVPDIPSLGWLLGEWSFSGAVFPNQIGVSAEDALRLSGQQFSGGKSSSALPASFLSDPRTVESLERLRVFASRFVDEAAEEILAREPRIVGCSSTFEQHCASLALLRRIRELDPTVVTMMGGANCEAEMGWATIRAFPWVDVVVSGEADDLFAPLCQLLLTHGADVSMSMVPAGVMVREHVRRKMFGLGGVPTPRAVVNNVSTNPVPDYSDFIEALRVSPLRSQVKAGLQVEFSRGCWWGQKHHCTFCGLNGGGMAYRAKPAAQALAELDQLALETGLDSFAVVDNIIDMSYLRTVLPALVERGAPYRLFFETKANLKRDQVQLLAKAGVIWIQPGIEALHDDLLKLMDKGTTAAINIQLLKYCREFGVHASWNLLFGFPGEDDAWHTEVAEWMPLCFHLQAPKSSVRVRYDRFGLYQQKPERYGLQLAPSPSYDAVYPLPPEDLMDLAYFFVDNSPGAQTMGPGARALVGRVVEWMNLFEREIGPILSMRQRGDAIDIYDTRPCAIARRQRLEGLDALVYQACEPAADVREVCRRLGQAGSDAGAVQAALERLTAQRLLLNLKGHYLALAVPGELPSFVSVDDFPGGNSRRLEEFTADTLNRFDRRTRALVGEPMPVSHV